MSDFGDVCLDGRRYLEISAAMWMQADAILQGMQFFQRPRRPSLNTFTGDLYHSEAHSQYLHQAKKRRQAEARCAEKEAQVAKTHLHWNARVLRHGDMLGSSAAPERSHDDRLLDLQSVLRQGWRSLGKDTTDREGIGGSHRTLAFVSSNSSVASECQNVLADCEMDKLLESRQVPVIELQHDATPTRCRFGDCLQERVMPHARYPIQDDVGEWSIVGFSEYCRLRGRGTLPRSGVLDLFACSGSMLYMMNGIWRGLRIFGRPCFLQAGNASCIYSATENMMPCFSVSRLTPMLGPEKLPFAFLVETPDDHSACSRKKEKSRLECPDRLGYVPGKCMGHQAKQ